MRTLLAIGLPLSLFAAGCTDDNLPSSQDLAQGGMPSDLATGGGDGPPTIDMAVPPGADLYLLMKVLNDWPDPEATAILRRCAEAARPDGRIAVVGGVSPNDVLSRLVVEMVLVGGKSRALDAFRALAGSAGLDVMATGYTASGRFVVECHPT